MVYQTFFRFTSPTIKFLSRQDVLVGSSFTYGFLTYCDRNVIKEPLSQMFGASIWGTVCSVGGDIVGSFMLPQLRPIVPLVLTVASGYHIKKEISTQK